MTAPKHWITSEVAGGGSPNEDGYLWLGPDETGQQGWLWLVVDGEGGPGRGDVAAALVIHSVAERYGDALQERGDPIAALSLVLAEAGDRLRAVVGVYPSLGELRASAAALAFFEGRAFAVTFGSARALQSRGDRLVTLAQGTAQAAIGGPQHRPAASAGPVDPDDGPFLLLTDGVDTVYEAALLAGLERLNPKDAATTLVELARRAQSGGAPADHATACVVRLSDARPAIFTKPDDLLEWVEGGMGEWPTRTLLLQTSSGDPTPPPRTNFPTLPPIGGVTVEVEPATGDPSRTLGFSPADMQKILETAAAGGASAAGEKPVTAQHAAPSLPEGNTELRSPPRQSAVSTESDPALAHTALFDPQALKAAAAAPRESSSGSSSKTAKLSIAGIGELLGTADSAPGRTEPAGTAQMSVGAVHSALAAEEAAHSVSGERAPLPESGWTTAMSAADLVAEMRRREREAANTAAAAAAVEQAISGDDGDGERETTPASESSEVHVVAAAALGAGSADPSHDSGTLAFSLDAIEQIRAAAGISLPKPVEPPLDDSGTASTIALTPSDIDAAVDFLSATPGASASTPAASAAFAAPAAPVAAQASATGPTHTASGTMMFMPPTPEEIAAMTATPAPKEAAKTPEPTTTGERTMLFVPPSAEEVARLTAGPEDDTVALDFNGEAAQPGSPTTIPRTADFDGSLVSPRPSTAQTLLESAQDAIPTHQRGALTEDEAQVRSGMPGWIWPLLLIAILTPLVLVLWFFVLA